MGIIPGVIKGTPHREVLLKKYTWPLWPCLPLVRDKKRSTRGKREQVPIEECETAILDARNVEAGKWIVVTGNVFKEYFGKALLQLEGDDIVYEYNGVDELLADGWLVG